MKKLLLIPFLLFCLKISAQKEIVLKDKYFVDISKIEHSEISVNEYLNFELFKKVHNLIKNNQRDEITNEDLAKGMENRVVKLSEGNYILENDEQKAKFKIDKNGNFYGQMLFEEKPKNETTFWAINFANGKVKSAELKGDAPSERTGKVTVSDSAYVVNIFDNQKLVRTSIIRHINGRDEKIKKNFYENGNLESERNQFSKIYKSFHEDGTPELYQNDKTNERIDYDAKGRKKSHFYLTKTEKCDEYFENGIITEKNCKKRDDSEGTIIYYKNGKPDKYSVTNYKTYEVKEYDRNKKLLEKYTSPPPSAPRTK